jgi:hypothetical protein
MSSIRKLNVSDDSKARFARSGPNRLYDDYKDRQSLAKTALIKLFDVAWDSGLDAACRTRSFVCAPEVARAKLKEDWRQYLDPGQEHRELRYQEMTFILQLSKQSADEYELTNVWKIPSDDWPRVLWVEFETVEERQQFRELATKLGYNDADLGLELLRDFMNKHNRLR